MKNLIAFFADIETSSEMEVQSASFPNRISEEEIGARSTYSKLSYEQSLREIQNLKETFHIKMNETSKVEPQYKQFNFYRNNNGKGNFFEIFKSLEAKWIEIIKKPQESISKTFTTNYIVIFNVGLKYLGRLN